jgi:phosphatidylglycerophosphate synthase
MARQSQPTDRGAFLDITLDFCFYASIPLAFAIANPGAHGLPAAALLASFMGTGASFLAFSALAQKRGLSSAAYPSKGLYYLGGLTEGTETILVFTAMCLWPQAFALLAWAFAGLCLITTLTRIWAGWRMLA